MNVDGASYDMSSRGVGDTPKHLPDDCEVAVDVKLSSFRFFMTNREKVAEERNRLLKLVS